MPRIDQFESLFKAASRTPFHYTPARVQKILIVLEDPRRYLAPIQSFLQVLNPAEAEWALAGEEALGSVGALIETCERVDPDLIVTWRNLASDAWRWHYSLGDHLDVLTQVMTAPVLVLPRPEEQPLAYSLTDTDGVMAVTDHLDGDERLVSLAAQFTRSKGTLWLTHIEDEAIFKRFVDVIGRIPSIDTDSAEEAIRERLLKEPRDYVRACREVLAVQRPSLQVEPVVRMGHRIADYKRLLDTYRVDLLVMHTKDDDQLAMHGMAYPLAVELRQVPLLLI